MSKDGEEAKEKRGVFARLFGRGASAPTSEFAARRRGGAT